MKLLLVLDRPDKLKRGLKISFSFEKVAKLLNYWLTTSASISQDSRNKINKINQIKSFYLDFLIPKLFSKILHFFRKCYRKCSKISNNQKYAKQKSLQTIGFYCSQTLIIMRYIWCISGLYIWSLYLVFNILGHNRIPFMLQKYITYTYFSSISEYSSYSYDKHM